jgi:hypothetical protein
MAEYALVVETIMVISAALYQQSGSIVNSILNRVLPPFTG